MTGVVRPVDLTGAVDAQRSLGWWGMICLIVTEASLFLLLLSSYVYVGAGSGNWPPRHPEIALPLVNTGILLSSSATAWWAHSAYPRSKRTALAALATTLTLGIVFLALQGYEYIRSDFSATADVHASLFYTITGFHGAHVLLGLIMLACTSLWIRRIPAGDHRASLRVSLMYWHFVDGVWLFVFTLLYVAPNL